MKASQLLRGSQQFGITNLPLPRSEGEDLSPIVVGLRRFDVGLQLQKAREYAVARGVPNPQEGDELYEYGKVLYTCLLGCTDTDSPAEKPEPFFDKGLEQLTELLGRDEQIMLAELHEQWQQSTSPTIKDFEPGVFDEALKVMAGPGGGAFFLSLRPALRLSFMRTSASLLLSLLHGKSNSSSTPGDEGIPSSKRHQSEGVDALQMLIGSHRNTSRLRIRKRIKR